jgi:uroporphyrinogen-III decarboxylase
MGGRPRRVKRKPRKRVCLLGNIDCAYILSEASTEEVDAAVKECILKASRGEGISLALPMPSIVQ